MKKVSVSFKDEIRILKETQQKIILKLKEIDQKIDDLKHEYVAVSIKGDRHEKWIKHLADKTGNDLPNI
jgi:hypothetical protein